MTKNTIKKITFIICLIALAVSWRIINYKYQIAPNLELVTVISVLAAITLGLRAAIIVPLAVMALSDAIIGNTSILFFTWGSFALIGASAVLLLKLNNKYTICCTIKTPTFRNFFCIRFVKFIPT